MWYQKCCRAGWVACAVVAVLFWAGSPALAQHRGGGGHGGGGHAGAYGGFHGAYGGHYGYYGGFRGGSYGFRGYYPWGWTYYRPYGGYRWLYGGYYPWYGAYSSFYPYSGYYPYGGYYPDGLAYPSSAPLYTPSDYGAAYPPDDPVGLAPANAATNFTVLVPAGATVTFDGAQTSGTGTTRQFVSPPLAPAQTYKYRIQAQWQDRGKPVVRSRDVPFTPGQSLTVDLRTAPGK